MKKILITLLLICLCIFCYGGNNYISNNRDIDSLQLVLNQTIKEKDIYIQLRQKGIDSLKLKLLNEDSLDKQFYLCRDIFNAYFDFQNDYAMDYVLRMCEIGEQSKGVNPELLLSAKIDKAGLLRYLGQLKEASELLEDVAKNKLSTTLRLRYLSERIVNYTFLSDNALSNEYKVQYDLMAEAYRDSLFMIVGPNESLLFRTGRLLKQGNPTQALYLLLDAYSKEDKNSKRSGTLAYNIAKCYEQIGDNKNLKRYLLKSSIADIRNGVRGYKSLQELASLMYAEGDVDRAYRYMKSSIEDATVSSARIRAQEATKMFVTIEASHQQKMLQQRQKIVSYFFVICIVGVLLVMSIIAIYFQYRRILSTKEKLAESNIIKDGYLGIFIEEYSNYLLRMNSYQMKSTKIVKMRDLEAMKAFLEEAFNTTDYLKELYRKFDNTILHIFPSFREDFNNLMKNETLPINNKSSNEKLTTEQRIVAVIRLGINDTEKIALFLRYSVRTVYNYRSQMRLKSKSPKTFEEDIMKIGRHTIHK